MTFSDLVPSREFAGEGKTGFEPSRTKFRCSERYGRKPVLGRLLRHSICDLNISNQFSRVASIAICSALMLKFTLQGRFNRS